MSHHNLNLTALLGARICHDLISPVGAISNGVELLSIAGDSSGSLTDLISDSATNANARLRLFRIAFGPTTDQMIAGDELQDITTGYFGDNTFEVTWPKGIAFSRSEAQIALLTCLVMETVLMRRAEIEVLSPTRIIGHAKRDPRLHPYWQILCEGGDWPETLQAGDVHFPLAQLALSTAGKSFRAWVEEQEFGIDLTPAPQDLMSAPFRRQSLGT